MKEILSKIFGVVGGGVADKISNIVAKHTFSKEDRAKLEQEMTQIFIEAENEAQKNVTERWRADLEHGNWLTRSVRPLVLIFLIFSTILLVFIDSGFIAFNVDDEWKSLLQLTLITVIGSYFGGRSFEKIKKNGKS